MNSIGLKVAHLAQLTHESGRVVGVGAHLAVDLNQTLHNNLGNVAAIQCVLETVTQENYQRQRLTELVRTLAGARCKNTPQFVQHPCLWGMQTLQMLLRTSGLKENRRNS